MIHSLLLLAAPAVISAPSQVLDVNPTVGPYFEISDAVAAASDGDVIRVSDGTYLSFVVDGLGVSIVPWSDVPAISVQGPVRIRNIDPGESVSLSGLQVVSPLGSFDTPLSVANASGSVRIQDCDIRPTATTAGIAMESASDVVLVNTSVTLSADGLGGAGIRAARSTLSLFAVTAAGGDTDWLGGAGSPAVSLFDSAAYASACTFYGGSGGPGYSDGGFGGIHDCLVLPGSGGAGVQLASGSSITALGCDVAAGFPGFDWDFYCPGGFAPPPFWPDATSTATELLGSGTEFHCPSRQNLGTPFPFTITADSTDFVMLAASSRSARTAAPAAIGSFLLDVTPGRVRRINLGAGSIQSSIDLPAIPALIGATWSFQTGHLRAGTLILGPARTVVFL